MWSELGVRVGVWLLVARDRVRDGRKTEGELLPPPTTFDRGIWRRPRSRSSNLAFQVIMKICSSR